MSVEDGKSNFLVMKIGSIQVLAGRPRRAVGCDRMPAVSLGRALSAFGGFK